MPNIAPTLTGVSGSVTFGENLVNAMPQLIDADVSFLDPDNNYSGGSFRITGLLAEDRVGLFNEGTGVGQVGISGSNVTYSNVTIGTFSGGIGSAFNIVFNAAATSTAIDAVIQHITYADVSDTPTAARTLVMNVFDAAGGDIEGAPSLTQLTGVNNLFSTFTTTQSYILPTGIDFDGDGDLDLAVGTDDGTLLAFRNNGNGTFTQLIGSGVNPFFGVDVGGFSSPAAGDVDNDGRLDLVVGADTHTLAYLHNNGNGTFTQLTAAANPFNGLNFNTISQPSSGDFDNDGDMDFIVTEATSTVHSFRNNGDNTFTELTGGANPFAAFAGQSTGSTFVDFDFDGDMDVLMGRSNGTLIYGRNNGNGTFTQLAGAANPFNGIDTGSYSSPVFIDIDGDSDLDMISGSSTRVLTTWRNNAVHGVSVTVNVTAEAEGSPPMLNHNAGLALNEGAAGTITATLLDFNDAEQADTAITYTVTTVATNGALRLGGATLGLGGTFTQDDINNNRVTYVHDGSETTSGAFGFSVSDGAGGTVSAQNFGFTVTPVNDAAVITGTAAGSVTEAGGVANGTAGTPGATGDLNAADVDNVADAWQAVAAGAATAQGYGSYALSAAGVWIFTLDDSNAAVQALNGAATLTDTFGALTADGTSQTVTITINAQNDAAILSADTRNLTETDQAVGTSGTLTSSDVDGPSGFVAQGGTTGTYGTFALGTDGAWTYTASSAYDELAVGQVYTDTFSVSSADGTATSVTVNIAGSNDAATLSADVANLTETDAAADLAASGTLTNSDIDGSPTFVAQSGTTGTYGTFAIGTDGAWTYTASSAHDELVDGQVYTDTFAVSAADGTATSVTINITGSNDAPVNTVPGAQTIDEDLPLVFSSGHGNAIAIGDADAGAGTVTVTLDIADGTLALAGTSGLTVTGDGGNHVVLTGTAADINAGLDGLSYQPAADVSGTRTLTVTTDDGAAGQDIDTIAIGITPVDDPAMAQDDPGNSTPENATLNIAVLANDGDIDGPPPSIAEVDGQAIAIGGSVFLASGAKVTLETDGTLTYDPNGQFDTLTSTTSGETGAANISAPDSFTYTLAGAGGGTATVDVTVTGVQSAEDVYRGDSGDNVITGTALGDHFYLEQGGVDIVSGGNGNDGFYFGAALTAADEVNGGAGANDQIGLEGDYSGGLILGANTLTNVEALVVLPGYSYDITTNDGNVASGERLIVQATQLNPGESLSFNGAAETDGSFRIYGGNGDDHLTGGGKNDGFYFGPGQFTGDDIVDGGPGGNDQLGLDGNYGSAGTPFVLDGNVTNVETVAFLPGPSSSPNHFDVTTGDAFVSGNQTMTIYAVEVTTDIVFDGSHESNGAFKIYSGSGSDVLIGGTGNDWIFGGDGADTLYGWGGNDVFYYDSASQSTPSGRDGIQDFSTGDIIDLSGIDAIAGGGKDAFTFIGGGLFTGQAGQLQAVNTSGPIWTVSGDTDGDGQANFQLVVVVTDNHPLTGADFTF